MKFSVIILMRDTITPKQYYNSASQDPTVTQKKFRRNFVALGRGGATGGGAKLQNMVYFHVGLLKLVFLS